MAESYSTLAALGAIGGLLVATSIISIGVAIYISNRFSEITDRFTKAKTEILVTIATLATRDDLSKAKSDIYHRMDQQWNSNTTEHQDLRNDMHDIGKEVAELRGIVNEVKRTMHDGRLR